MSIDFIVFSSSALDTKEKPPGCQEETPLRGSLDRVIESIETTDSQRPSLSRASGWNGATPGAEFIEPGRLLLSRFSVQYGLEYIGGHFKHLLFPLPFLFVGGEIFLS